MPALNNLVKFDVSRLFNGAIDVDWIISDPDKAKHAARSFVFHGPAYHGVAQRDVDSTGHRLIDSASFCLTTLKSLNEECDRPFALAIAGYGSGKSHIALTLSELLETSNSDHRHAIVANIAQADEAIADNIREILPEVAGKTLLITLNGMNNFDLSTEMLKQVKAKFVRSGISTDALDELRKRFTHAANLLKGLDPVLLQPLFDKMSLSTREAILEKLSAFDETTYSCVHDFLQSIGISLKALGDETAKDVLKLLASQYVGADKPFQKILVIFDEFGRYLEFATTHSQIAGNGALQQLYEGVQDNSNKIAFVGFIQYELKVYEQRLPSDFKNEIRRFITRFQNSERLYLSINLETLIANLLVKNKAALQNPDIAGLKTCFQQIQSWFPESHHHTLWHSEEMFLQVIGKGCWPLSPLAVWVLFHLSAGGQYLQQRSALSLLKAALDNQRDFELTEKHTLLPPVRIWSDDLESEFLDVEELSGHGAITQAYRSVFEGHRQHLTENEILLLRSMVLASITRLKTVSREEAQNALIALSGVSKNDFVLVLRNLEEELNIVSWDDSFKQFEILGDSISKAHFLKFLRQKLDVEYDVDRQEGLFSNNAALFPELLKPIECDFAQNYSISTPEWVFAASFTSWSRFVKTIKNSISIHLDNIRFNTVDNERGLAIYCFVPGNLSPDDVMLQGRILLHDAAKKNNCNHLPVILILLCDQGEMGKTFAELDIIDKLESHEKEMYGKMASIYAEKRRNQLRESVKKSLESRRFVTTFPEDSMPSRLTSIGNTIFEKVYPKPLSFPFDGYKSARTNGAKDCADFTRKCLFMRDFTFDLVQSFAQQQRNRASQVLKQSWRVFNTDGSLVAEPKQANAKSIVSEWEKLFAGNQELNCAKALEVACAPPFGANLASAGLLFAVYVQARQKILTLQENHEQAEFAAIGDRLFEGNLLSVKTLSCLTLYKEENNDSEWEQLLNQWASADSYVELIEFTRKADDLHTRIQIPKPLRDRERICRQYSKNAQEKLNESNEAERKAYGIIDRASLLPDVYELSYGGSLLQICGKKKINDPYWRKEDSASLADKITKVKQKIIQHFDGWLAAERPNGDTMEALNQFKVRILDRMGRNLKELELTAQYDLLVKHYERISKHFEGIAACQRALSDIDAWLASNSNLPNDMTLTQLNARKEEIQKHIDRLKPHNGLNDILIKNALTNRVKSLKEVFERIKAKIKIIHDKSKSIWDSILLPETAVDLNNMVLDLERLYTGADTDVQDFRIMKNILQAYLDVLKQLKSYSLSWDDFHGQLANWRTDMLNRFAEAEIPGGWKLEEAIDTLGKYCLVYRDQASRAWMTATENALSQLQEMATAQANDLLRAIISPPLYVNISTEKERLEKARGLVEDALSSKEVEWLLERFNKMSAHAQGEFLKAVTDIMETRRGNKE